MPYLSRGLEQGSLFLPEKAFHLDNTLLDARQSGMVAVDKPHPRVPGAKFFQLDAVMTAEVFFWLSSIFDRVHCQVKDIAILTDDAAQKEKFI
jgi:hypothetical protein